jgi:ribosomal protein L11
MNYTKEIKHIKKCFLMSQKAEPIPPLGTILGNIGVNTIKFCEEFNTYTKNLPNYFLVKVTLNIYENRSFVFNIKNPSTGFLLNLLKIEKTIQILVHNRKHNKIINCIKLKDLVQIALYKFPKLSIIKTILIL